MTCISSSQGQTVSAVAVVDLANELRARGWLDASAMDAMGHDFMKANHAWSDGRPIEEWRLPEHLLVELWGIADGKAANSDFGLNLGARINLSAKGLLANWLSQSATLGEALAIFCDNIALLNPSEHWRKVERATSVGIEIGFASSDYPQIAVDRSMAANLAWCRMLSGVDIHPIAVTFSYAEPAYSKAIADRFQCEVSFQQPANIIWYEPEIFEHPTLEPNHYLKQLLEKQAALLLNSLSSAGSVAEAVRQLLRVDLARYCQITEVCTALHLSRSSLYRKLKQEGTHFTQLLKQSRLAALDSLPLSHLSGDEMAEILGFEDNSSYYRFKKMVDLEHSPGTSNE